MPSEEISIINKLTGILKEDQNIHPQKEQLIALINELINKDFPALIQLLYKTDINEDKLKHLLKEHKNSNTATIISDLIIARQLQKANSRKHFKASENMDESELW